MERKGGLLLVFVVLALSAVTTNATIVTIGITGEITDIYGYDKILSNVLKVGDTVTGYYIYDSSTPDSNPSDILGLYKYTNLPYGISLYTNGLVFKTNPENIDFFLSIGNNYNGFDFYLLRSDNNILVPTADVCIGHITWQLQDDSGIAFSTDTIPTKPPQLENWPGDWGLRIYFGDRLAGSILTKVTSVQIMPVPEPTTVLFLYVGVVSWLIKRR